MMTNLLHGAHVANKLFSTIARLRLLLVMFVALSVSANAWGATETITLSDFGWSNASVQSSITATSATISLAQNNAGTAPTYYTSDGLRIYGVKSATTGGTISFTPKKGITISKIVFTHTSEKSGVLAIKTGVGSYSSKTWSGTLTEGSTVSLVSTNNTTSGNPQVKVTKIVITYETAAAATPIDVTLHYKGTSTTISNQTSPYTLPTTGDYVADACDGWEFAGWYGSEYENSETEPSYITQLPSTGDAYAVYSHTETTQGGGSSEENVDFSSQGYSNQQEVSSYNGTNFSVAFDKGSNSNTPKYYTSGTAIRIYGGGYFTVSSETTITKIVLGFGSSDGSNAITTDVNTYSDGTWTGSANSVTFTIGGSSGNRRIASLTVTTSGGGSTTYYHSTPDCGSTQPTPSLTASESSLLFGEVTIKSSKELTFNLSGSDLTANATLAISGTDEGMFSLSSNSVTQSEGSINQTITVTYTPTATGSHNATLTISSTGAESKTVALSGTGTAPAAKYTVTFDAGSGSCSTTSLQETSSGNGVKLPIANPPAACATDDWEFAGWWPEAVAETTASPGELLTADSNYKPTKDCTLYAVYSKTETTQGGGGTENVSSQYTFSDYTAGTQYAENEEHELDDVLTLTTTQCHFTSELRIYSSDAHNGYVVSNQLPGRIISIGFNAGNNSDEIAVYGSTDGDAWTDVGHVSVISTYKDYTLSFGENNYTYFKLDVVGANQVRLKSITITWESTTSGGGSTTTTTYNSNPECCELPTVGTTTYSNLGANSVTITCQSGITSLGSSAITDYGFACGTSSNPTTKKTIGGAYTTIGQSFNTSINSLQPNTTYYVRAYATNNCGTTYGQETTFKTSSPEYTVTWIVDGTPEHSQTGTAGTKLTNIPTPDDCNATTKFVGWTTIPGYSHATIAPTGMITDTEGMTIPVNGATYYAVFAEGEGSGSQDHTITLTADNLNLTSNNGYQEAESTINGFYFLVDKGYKGSVNSKSVIQMKYEEDQNAGLLYNQNAIPNLKSITVNVAQGGNAFEIYEDDSFDENDYGTLLAEPTGTTTQNFSSGSQYFTISVYGVVYFSSIIITYTENEGSSYSNYTTSCSATDCAPTDIQYSSDLNSITVSWNAQSATSIVYLYTDEAGTQEHTHASAEKSQTFTGLNSNTTYYIKIVPGEDLNCASPIIPVKTQIVEMDVIEWKTDGIIVDINTSENIRVVLENEVQYGTGTANKAEDLFFSKYFEGSGSMKLVAIYNGTGQSVSLDNYMIYKKAASQDGNWNSTNDDEYALTSLGSIAHGQEIIFYTRPEQEHLTDCSNDFFNKVKSGKNDNPRWIECNDDPFDKMDFNGNDAIILYKGNEPIDIIGATGTPGTDPNCRGGGSEQGWAGEVTNMDYGKSVDDPSFDAFYANSSIDFTDYTDEDKKEFLSNCGIDIENETINMTTARCILFRDNSVTSGVNTNTGTTFASFTSNEWNGRSVCQTSAMYNAAGFDSDGQATCNSYQDLGSFNYSDYYTKYDPMPNDAYGQAISNGDGTWTVRISNLNKQSCRKLQVIITNTDGNLLKKEQYKVPIMIDENQTTAGPAFIALQANLATIITDGAGNVTGTQNLELDEVREICKECDVVILDNATLTKAQDNTANDHPQVHDVVVYEGGSLVIPDGESYNYTINNLSLRRKGDKVASVQIEGDGELVLPESTPVTLSMRIDATNWHWFTLPYNCNIADVTWSDGTPAKYGTDWFLMWYDGESRAASTNPRDNHWKKYTGSNIEAGKGYIIGITGNLAHPNYTFELRFPMEQGVLTAEQTNKTVALNAWGMESDNTPNNLGWNLVGNPYLNYYKTADEYSYKGLPLIKYTEDPETGEWSGTQSGDIPYLVTPVNGGWSEYQQELASNVNMLPFTAYFVQVGNPGTHTDEQELQAEFNPSNRGRASLIRRAPSEVDEQEEPAIVAVELTNSKGESDKTTLLIADRFTNEYEMNADFFKWFGDYYTYYTKPVLYTIGADNESRAFNALNEQLAAQPVELGMFAAQAGNYTFSLNQRSNLTGVAEVWLHDANSNTHTNLMQDDYTFSTAKTNGAGRFSLSVKMASKVTTAVDNITAQGIWATTQDNQIVINGLAKDLQLWIYDTTGKLLHADHTTNYQHSYSVPTSGVYFVRVNGKTEAQTIKVVVE